MFTFASDFLPPATLSSCLRALALAGGIAAVFSPAHADLSASVAPAGNFSLTHWKLTEPVDSTGGTAGGARDVSSATLTAGTGYSSKWFSTASDGGVVFWAPVNGATTSGSDYPRSELREQATSGSDKVNWFYDGDAVLIGRLRVNAVPSSGKLVIGQIHGLNASPLVKLRYYYTAGGGGRLDALVQATPSSSTLITYKLATNLPLNALFDYNITVSKKVLSMSVNGAPPVKHTIDASWAGIGFYFKAGAYTQAKGSSSTDGGRTTFYRIAASHPSNGLSVVNSSLPSGKAGAHYVQVLTSLGGAGSVQWSLASGRLPDGLSLDRNTGIISGYLPAKVASTRDASFVVMVTDATGASAAQVLLLNITP